MDARLNYFADPTAGKALKYFMSAGKALKGSPLPGRMSTKAIAPWWRARIEPNHGAPPAARHTHRPPSAGTRPRDLVT